MMGCFLRGIVKNTKLHLGKVLAIIFCVCLMLSALLSVSAFQMNQLSVIAADSLLGSSQYSWIIGIFIATGVAITIIGGVTRITAVAEKIINVILIIYVIASLIILLLNYSNIPNAFKIIVDNAFDFKSATMGAFTSMIIGIQRAIFSGETALGSVPIVHAKTNNPDSIREGILSMVGPLCDAFACSVNGLLIVVTMSHLSGYEGIMVIKNAFATVSPWFPYILTFCIIFLGFSTIIAWYYYGESCYCYLTSNKYLKQYKILYCIVLLFATMMSFNTLINFVDIIVFLTSIPNIICAYILASFIKQSLMNWEKEYKNKL